MKIWNNIHKQCKNDCKFRNKFKNKWVCKWSKNNKYRVRKFTKYFNDKLTEKNK